MSIKEIAILIIILAVGYWMGKNDVLGKFLP